jgi:hypothetical protein
VQTKRVVSPTDTLLVVDAMTGQEAAGLVKAFNDAGGWLRLWLLWAVSSSLQHMYCRGLLRPAVACCGLPQSLPPAPAA